ncbi:SRPBCC family protein [Geobacter sp. SVR]|uniref:SRPBCC family protein n=1 Tax=Geobacter sp. SVR TaxID=2495594 RepID=UPI00143EFD08|nr:SRPBCC family protein [Geobacter sp. SVR]BCS54500.1 SRPBCC domain-containing protein [Geobacter sp. SVR]GCF87100.1 SRPBCC domain-containing protein [Geobacter sp. SVR]
MKPFILERSQFLPVVDLAAAWIFFSDACNLAHITPPGMGFRMTSPPLDDIYPGRIISYSVRPLFGITMDWTSEITHLEKPFFFIDEQRFGPYRFWQHQHRFREVAGGVEVRDLVHYLLPRMPFTRLVNRLIVEPRLKEIFDYRREALKRLFPPPDPAP